MSWNIQRPDGVGVMAPSESQAYMSHEQLLSNRDALERKLSQRRPRQELVNRGIMPAVSAAPGILSQRAKLERAKTGDILQRKIRTRPNRAQLIQRHILKETPGAVDPSLIDKQMRLKRKKLEDNLNDKLSFRPGPLELVKENILEAGTAISQAVQEGTVPFTDTTDYLDSFSPESINDSPEASPSPEPCQVASPPSVASSPGSTCITSTVQALASLQAQTKKHTQQQQEKQQQQHQMFLQQQNNQLLTTPSPLSASLQGSKKEGKSRKKTAKPKVKKYKYHEYRPPNGEVQKSDLPSDSPYGLLLQQQQLYLQLQVLYQNYPHHCMLPSIPENVKLGMNGSKNNNGAESEKTVKIEDMRVVDMRRALKERGLPVFGSKTDLIKRLKEAGPLVPPAVSSSSAPPVVVSTQGQITTSAPSVSQSQDFPKQAGHPTIHRSHSLPLQNANLNAVEQLKMQILANNQSLQQLSVPPEVQQQLQQLQYLNLQLQLQHLNIQHQQNIQPKPQDTPASSQPVAVKKESLTDSNCSFSQPPVQNQAQDQKPSFTLLQQQSQHLQMSPRSRSPQPSQQQLQQVDRVDQALAHLQEQAQTLDLSSPHIDSNPSSVESQILSWDQQHPLFDGESESYPSPGSQHSDMSSFSPLQVDHLSHSMEALHNTNQFQGNAKPDNHHMQRSYSERTPDCPDDYFLMVPQTKPRSMSEPQFPVSTHKRSSSFPSMPFSTPPPSYEAHMAAQSHKQQRNIALPGGQMGCGFAMTNDVSPKHEDMDLPLESVIQDKELSQELHKAMMKNFSSLDHDEILEILGEPRTQLPMTTSSFAGVVSSSYVSPVNSQTTMSKSPSMGYLRTLPAHNSPGRMSRSCEDVSQLPVGNKFPLQMDNYNTLSDFDHMLMSPLSPMKVDSCETDDNSSLMYHSSNSIPIPSSNGGIGRTDNLSWLDLSLSPSAQHASPHGNVELLHHNNNNKGTPPTFLYDPATAFKGDEAFPLSLFDLETPTALHPPSDFTETMDYCV